VAGIRTRGDRRASHRVVPVEGVVAAGVERTADAVDERLRRTQFCRDLLRVCEHGAVAERDRAVEIEDDGGAVVH
jgi:hypothetical protein